MSEGKAKLIPVYIMGKKYYVPEGSTIIGALEYAGFQLVRGVGCREGFCGACTTVYRLPGDYKLKVGLACGTVVQPNMELTQIPFTPTQRPLYKIEELKPDIETFKKLFPAIFRCLACNTCTKACPQEIKVMDYVQALIRGDIAQAAEISFDCIMCGVCAMRCPAEIVPFEAGLLARRLYARYMMPKSPELAKRIKEIEEGKWDKELNEFIKKGKSEWEKKYWELRKEQTEDRGD